MYSGKFFMSIQIRNLTVSESIIQDLSKQEVASIIGGGKGGTHGSNHGGGGPAPAPAPVGGVNPIYINNVGPGNSRQYQFIVTPNGDTYNYTRQGSKSTTTYLPGFNNNVGYGGGGFF
jgi:FtsP/CotA-like multicopper oxidase with cupredoxin domain